MKTKSVVICGIVSAVALAGVNLLLFPSSRNDSQDEMDRPYDAAQLDTDTGDEYDNSLPAPHILTPLRDVDRAFYTIRINTWERPELLTVSVNHHSQCPGVAQIQVVWCEGQGEPPAEVIENPKVVIERHTVNSLNERFNMILATPTLGILSMDDDVLRPCEAIDSGFFKWTQNTHRMVAYDARLHVDTEESWTYAYMSTSKKVNRYSISLTRYCFLHRDYLSWYTDALPRPIYQKVEESFNCEDIAMSFYVSSLTGGLPPLLADYWAINSMLKLYTKKKISGTHEHKKIRDECVDSFAEQLGLKSGPNPLQISGIIRRERPIFECGAKPDSYFQDGKDSIIPRQKALLEKIEHWKTLSVDTVVKEVGKMKAEISRAPFELGLIEHTEPWKKRWGKR